MIVIEMIAVTSTADRSPSAARDIKRPDASVYYKNV